MTTNTIIKKRTLEWVILSILIVFAIVVIVLVIYLMKCHKAQKDGCDACEICSSVYDNQNKTYSQCCRNGKNPNIDVHNQTTSCE